MLGILGSFPFLFKTNGSRTLAGATPSNYSAHSLFRKDNHAGKARRFGTSTHGVASLADYCAADSVLSATPRGWRTGPHRPRLFSLLRNPALHVRLLTHPITAIEFTGLALGRIL